MRRLVYVAKIADIQPIPDADQIEVATVLGWQVVVKKGQFRPGDKAVYFEIDSVLPEAGPFEFLRKSSFINRIDGLRGFRLRTMKMRGQISQGLLMPLSIIEEYTGNDYSHILDSSVDDINEKLNLVELLEVEKFEVFIPPNLGEIVKGEFMRDVPKTNETRVQVLNGSDILNVIEKSIYVTEKLDGTSITVSIKDGEFDVCSRSVKFKDTPDNIYWRVSHRLDLENKLKSLNRNIALQGELVGPGIQGNPYKLHEFRVYWFTAFDIDRQVRLDFNELVGLLDQLDLDMVPEVKEILRYDLPRFSMLDWLHHAEGYSELNPESIREGIVVRSIDGSVGFKVINNDYLIKHKC